MSTVISRVLDIVEDTVEQYCTADGLSLNTGGYAIRLYLNGGKTGYAIINDAGKEVLYPTATAHPIKADSVIRASRSAGTMSVNLQFGGTNVHSASFSSTSLKDATSSDITDSTVTGSTRSTQIRWQVNGSSTVSNFRVAQTHLTLYFNEYSMSANIGTGANGVKSVAPSASVAYDGDTITFSAALYTGAVWHGWFSDAACTSLVSSEQTYSVSPNTDVTLYAKATLDAALYNCSAVAGTEIASASVSESVVVDGDSCTFSAQPNEGCVFNGWYSDSACTALVSTNNPYTATITSDTTLYAKATRSNVHLSVGTAEHGTATVSATTVAYGSNVTYRFTPEDETWELYGWYSDAALTKLVSEDNPYTFAAKADTTLYPMVGRQRYTITLKGSATGSVSVKLAAVNYSALTRSEIECLKTGEYDSIDSSKIYAVNSQSKSYTLLLQSISTSVKCPLDMYIALYVGEGTALGSIGYGYISDITWWPYYWTPVTGAHTYVAEWEDNTGLCACDCSAIALDGVDYVDATTPTIATKDAIFTAEVATGYRFKGWYSDSECTTLVSTDNPASVTTPEASYRENSTTYKDKSSLTLYAKAIPVTSSTNGIYLKANNTWVHSPTAYKKSNGVWVEDTESCLTQLSQCGKVRVIDVDTSGS